MIKRFGIILGMFFALALPVRALDIITATISVTAQATNGQTITANGDLRTWTNVVTSPSAQIATSTNGAAASATNLFRAIGSSPFLGLALSRSDSNNITLQTAPGGAITVTLSAGWGTVAYATQSLVSATVVRVPIAVETAAQRTNVSSGIAAILDAPQSTNQVHENAPSMANFVGRTNAQTISGSKTFTGANIFSNALQFFTGGTLSNVNIVGLTNITGTVGVLSNGSWDGATLTNGRNFGLAFRSKGAGLASEQLGTGAEATGDYSTAVANMAKATNYGAAAFGALSVAGGRLSGAFGGSAFGDYSLAFGPNSEAHAFGSVALGPTVIVTHSNAVSIGYGSSSTRPYQITLGNSLFVPEVLIPGNLTVQGRQTNITAAGQANFPAGSDIAFGRFAVTSLANGHNAAIDIGGSTFIEVSGPSGPFWLDGFAGGRNGKPILVLNRTGQPLIVANQSGVEPTAANRIDSLVGGDVTNGNCLLTFVYSSAASRWMLGSLGSGTNSGGGGGGGSGDSFWITNTVDGGIQFSNPNSSIKINMTDPGTFAGGYTNVGEITASGNGAFAYGNSESVSEVRADGPGTICLGRAIDGGQLDSTGYGSLAFGYVSDSGSIIQAANIGSFAGGGAQTGGHIYAFADADFAYGYAADSGVIQSDVERGAFSLGNAQGAGSTITATGIGSMAGGVATNGALHSASGEAGWTWGKNVGNSGNRAFAFGRGFTNSTDESFTVGWGAPAFSISSFGLSGPQGVIGDWTLSPDGSATFGAGTISFSGTGDILAAGYTGNYLYTGAITNAGVAPGSLLQTDADSAEAAVASFINLAWDGTSLSWAPTNHAAHLFLAGPTSGGAAIPTWRAIVGSDLTTASIDPNAGFGTNITIYGDSHKTNAYVINPSFLIESNALGSVTMAGGNLTNSGYSKSTTNYVDRIFIGQPDMGLMRQDSSTLAVIGTDGTFTNSISVATLFLASNAQGIYFGTNNVMDSGRNFYGQKGSFNDTVAAPHLISTNEVSATNGFLNSTANIKWVVGSGSPESAVSAPVGSLYSRTDGGANTTLYVKESGSGNTGWQPK